MSIFGMMRTSIAGMAVQADRLGTVSDNVANAKTTGYKEAATEFSTLVLESAPGQYQSGSVETHVRHLISKQGSFDYTSSSTDLAIKGEGFFVVQGQDSQTFLTRAGSFVKNQDGDLVNAAGYTLMGVRAGTGGAPSNGAAGLEVINIGSQRLKAVPSTTGTLTVNLDSRATAVTTSLPSNNVAGSTFTSKNSIIAYGNKGEQVTLDLYYTKTAADTWEIAVFDQADATSGGFPYATAPLSTTTVNFDPANGELLSPTNFSVTVPGGQAVTLDITKSSQLASAFAPREVVVDGNAAADVDHVEVTDKGEVYGIYTNGARVLNYTIPLAKVPSPDNLTPVSGNVFSLSATSGDILVGAAGGLGLGSIVSNALEASTVDIATQLTTMIETQRNYTANSKVFQIGAELSDVLVNLVR